MTKYSYCQEFSYAYIINSKYAPSYFQCLRDKKSYNVVSLSLASVSRLISDIQRTKLERYTAKAKWKRWLNKFLATEARLNRQKASESLLNDRRGRLIQQGWESLEAEGQLASEPKAQAAVARPPIDIPSIFPKFVQDSETERVFTYLVDPDVSSETLLLTKGIS